MEGAPISLRIVPAADIAPAKAAEAEAAEALPDLAAGKDAAETIRQALEFRYPHMGAVELPTKISATEMKKYDSDGDTAPLKAEETEFEFRRPALGGSKLSAAARGSAAHTFLQYADFAAVGSREAIAAQLHALTERGLLTREEAEAVNLAALLRFFESDTGRLILSAEKLHREFRFTLLQDAAEIFGPEARGEELLLQGVIDCLIEEAEELTVIDYKTDAVSAEGAEARARRYESQLRLYAESAERIFGKRVKRRILHFLTPGVNVEL